MQTLLPKFATFPEDRYTYDVQIVFMKAVKRMYSVDNSNTFLAYYNQLDKYLAYVLWLTKYMPFTEKIDMLTQGRYLLTSFAKIYQNKLRYLGDLRNQLVHGFRLDNKHYVLASDHAIVEVKALFEEARSPKTVFDLFAREVYTCSLEDSLKEVITTMKKELYTHVPVYDSNGKFMAVLSESTIAYWLADEIDAKGKKHLEQISIGDLLLENANDVYMFVEKSKSIYEIEDLFAQSIHDGKRLWAIFISATGDKDEPIEGIVTSIDIPKLSEHFVL